MQLERHLAIEFIVNGDGDDDGGDGDRVGESNEDGVLVAISLKPAEEQKCSNGWSQEKLIFLPIKTRRQNQTASPLFQGERDVSETCCRMRGWWHSHKLDQERRSPDEEIQMRCSIRSPYISSFLRPTSLPVGAGIKVKRSDALEFISLWPLNLFESRIKEQLGLWVFFSSKTNICEENLLCSVHSHLRIWQTPPVGAE